MKGFCKYVLFPVSGAVWLWAAVVVAAIELPEGAEREAIHPGAWAFSWTGETAEGPVAIHGFYWVRGNEELSMVATAGRDQVRGTEETSRQAERHAGASVRPLAAVNADFFVVRGPGYGSVHGPFIRDGELLSLGDSPAAAILEDGSLAIAELEISVWLETHDGARIRIDRVNHERGENQRVLYTPSWNGSTATGEEGVEVRLKGPGHLKPDGEIRVEVAEEPRAETGDMAYGAGEFVLSAEGEGLAQIIDLRPGDRFKLHSRMDSALPIVHAVGGLPVMIRDGEVLDFEGADPDDYIPGPGDPNARHPRTAIGTDGRHIVALAVDGRAPGHSDGMTVPELGRFMRQLGCTDAINLDGGGSTTAWAAGRALNRPSDGSERPVGNALVLVVTQREQ